MMNQNELFEFLDERKMMPQRERNDACTTDPDIVLYAACDFRLTVKEVALQEDNAMLKRFILGKVDNALADIRGLYEKGLEDLK